MSLLAIDPGTTESGWVALTEDNLIWLSGVERNADVLDRVYGWGGEVAIERFEARGMAAPMGDSSVETILWTGRFMEAAREIPVMVKRSAVKLHLCGTTQAKDPNVRQALIDIFGPKGVKAAPGGTYGVSKHAWAALGVAATVRGLR